MNAGVLMAERVLLLGLYFFYVGTRWRLKH